MNLKSKFFKCAFSTIALLLVAGCRIEVTDINFISVKVEANHPTRFDINIKSSFESFDDEKNAFVNCLFVPNSLTDLKIELHGTVFKKTKSGDRYNYVIYARTLKNGVDVNEPEASEAYYKLINDMKKFTNIACEIRQMSYVGPSGPIAKFSFPVSSLLEADEKTNGRLRE